MKMMRLTRILLKSVTLKMKLSFSIILLKITRSRFSSVHPTWSFSPIKRRLKAALTQIAFYFEKPMLVTDVGGLKEIVPDGKCGYVVKPEPEFITEAMLDFFENNRMKQFTEGVKKEKEKIFVGQDDCFDFGGV